MGLNPQGPSEIVRQMVVLLGPLRIGHIWGQSSPGEVFISSLRAPKSRLGPNLPGIDLGLYRVWGLTRCNLGHHKHLASLGDSPFVMPLDQMPTNSGPPCDWRVYLVAPYGQYSMQGVLASDWQSPLLDVVW